MTGIEHEENRQFQRMLLNSPLQFRRAGTTTLYKGETLDLSATGVRFKTAEAIENGEVLQIVINSQHPEIAPLVAEGLTIRSVAFAEELGEYEISVLFNEII